MHLVIMLKKTKQTTTNFLREQTGKWLTQVLAYVTQVYSSSCCNSCNDDS